MPGRRNPEPTENEKKSEYRLQQKRGHGDTVAGNEAAFLDEEGGAAEVRREREARQADRDERGS